MVEGIGEIELLVGLQTGVTTVEISVGNFKC